MNIHQMLKEFSTRKMVFEDRVASKIAHMGKGIVYSYDKPMPSHYLKQDRDYEYGVSSDNIKSLTDIAYMMQEFAKKVYADKPKDKDIAVIGYLNFTFGDALMQKPTSILGAVGWYTEEEVNSIKDGDEQMYNIIREVKNADTIIG